MTSILSTNGITEVDLLILVAAVEKLSEHPVAAAIVREAEQRKLKIPSAENFQSFTGQGAAGEVLGRQIVVGTSDFLAGRGIDTRPIELQAETLSQHGQTIVLAAVDEKVAGLIAVADPIKASAREAVASLKRSGLRLVMLTGDNRATAEAIAKELDITEFEAEVLPEHKLEIIKKLQAEGRIVAMAGDGVNDAPALAQANVGIAMGTGTDIAIESAGVTLVKGDLHGIVRARRLSRATMRNIRQNLFFAFVYNALGVPIAGGALYSLAGLTLSPMIAAAAMALSSVSVVGNALRLAKFPLRES